MVSVFVLLTISIVAPLTIERPLFTRESSFLTSKHISPRTLDGYIFPFFLIKKELVWLLFIPGYMSFRADLVPRAAQASAMKLSSSVISVMAKI